MLKKCKVCGNEFEATRTTKTTCSDSCRQKLSRVKVTVTKIQPVTVTKPLTTEKEVTVTKRDKERKLVFTKEPIKERIKKYKEMYPESTYVPNWVVNGYNSMEEAIVSIVEKIRNDKSVQSSSIFYEPDYEEGGNTKV